MKEYIKPQIDISVFEIEEMIMASGITVDEGNTDPDWGELN